MTVLENVPRIQDVFCMMGDIKNYSERIMLTLDGHILVDHRWLPRNQPDVDSRSFCQPYVSSD